VDVVAYVANLGDAGCIPPGCEWRILHPSTGRSDVLWRLPGPPLNVYWDSGFTAVYYRVADTVYRQLWRVGATPEVVVTVPRQLVVPQDAIRESIDDLWRDRESDAWRLLSVELRDTQATAAVWEYSAVTRQWRILQSSTECDLGGSVCDAVSSFVAPESRVTLKRLLDEMRVEHHLERTEPAGIWNEGPRTFPSTTTPGAAIRVGVVLGDTYHAWAPLWHVSSAAVEALVYGKVEGCYEQLAFKEIAGVLLVAEEFTGACARVVSMATGAVSATLPSTSRSAVWVSAPFAISGELPILLR
jgi:hypothetical protein